MLMLTGMFMIYDRDVSSLFWPLYFIFFHDSFSFPSFPGQKYLFREYTCGRIQIVAVLWYVSPLQRIHACIPGHT
jgi:hypothetical protein